jgi:hypothetical protein
VTSHHACGPGHGQPRYGCREYTIVARLAGALQRPDSQEGQRTIREKQAEKVNEIPCMVHHRSRRHEQHACTSEVSCEAVIPLRTGIAKAVCLVDDNKIADGNATGSGEALVRDQRGLHPKPSARAFPLSREARGRHHGRALEACGDRQSHVRLTEPDTVGQERATEHGNRAGYPLRRGDLMLQQPRRRCPIVDRRALARCSQVAEHAFGVSAPA